MGSRRRPESFLPLPVSEFEILLALADGERQGYSIMTDVAERTRGSVRLGPGTLYGSVKRMLASGLIDDSPAKRRGTDDDERRRYYCLTTLGRAVAAAEAARLEELVRQARRKRLLPAMETP
jgi:DNA-binding PadR family transcriptional regulator